VFRLRCGEQVVEVQKKQVRPFRAARNVWLLVVAALFATRIGLYVPMSKADSHNTNLRGAILVGSDLRSAYMIGADLRGATLTIADLSGAILAYADLSGAILIKADLRSAILSGASLVKAKLGGADLRGANLHRAELRGAELRDAEVGDAVLQNADLSLADLSGVKNLTQEQLDSACGTGVKLDPASKLTFKDKPCPRR
jgi:uncharacterized protein YjbI with pentapeptide repeats